MLAVVEGGVLWEEAGAGWGDVGVADVREDAGGGFGGGFGVLDYAYAEFVGAAFEADCYHFDGDDGTTGLCETEW